MFCPFINNNCVKNCVFNNHKFTVDSVENCTLVEAAQNLQLAKFPERTPKNYLDSIESKLSHIETNTERNQADSWQINENMNNIVSRINDIKKLLQK